MASPQLQELIDQMRSAPPIDPTLTPQQQRANYETITYPMPDNTTVTPVDAGGVPGEWVVAQGADPARRLLHLHGGGYVIGSVNSHRDLAAALSHASGCAALILDYRLAPEHPYPAALDDALAAYRWMRANGPNGAATADATFIAGDSAGGGLTLATMLAARDAGDPLPDAAVTISAWTDLTQSGDSIIGRAEADPRVTVASLDKFANCYLNGADAKTPLASPLSADLAGLPPLLIQVGDAEILLDDSTVFADKAKAAGVDVTLEVWPEMFHVWHHQWAVLPEAQQAVDRIGEYLKTHVAATA